MFDWYARGRTTQEIQKRCDQLINQFKKEFTPPGGKVEKAAAPKSKPAAKLGKRKREGSSDADVEKPKGKGRGRPKRGSAN